MSAVLLGALLLAAPFALAAADGPTPYPTRASDWPGQGFVSVMPWMPGNRQSFWRERADSRGRVVFVGDSLTGGWRTLADDWPGLPVANRGIGGETTRMLLFRFREDVLDLRPKAIVLLSGTNDLSARQDVRASVANLAAMLAMAQRESPDTPIVLCTVPPRANPQASVAPGQLDALNAQIRALAEGRPNVRLFDLHAALQAADGGPDPALFQDDRLHLAPAGYRRWHDALAPLLNRLGLGG